MGQRGRGGGAKSHLIRDGMGGSPSPHSTDQRQTSAARPRRAHRGQYHGAAGMGEGEDPSNRKQTPSQLRVLILLVGASHPVPARTNNGFRLNLITSLPTSKKKSSPTPLPPPADISAKRSFQNRNRNLDDPSPPKISCSSRTVFNPLSLPQPPRVLRKKKNSQRNWNSSVTATAESASLHKRGPAILYWIFPSGTMDTSPRDIQKNLMPTPCFFFK